MTNTKNSKNWIIEPSENCVQYIGEEIIQTTIIQRSIVNLLGMQTFLNIAKAVLLKKGLSVKGIDYLIKDQVFLEEKSKELISSKYNSINAHSLVSLWASIETAIEDTIVLFLCTVKIIYVT